MRTIGNQISEIIGAYIPNLIGALAILIIGWLVALLVAAILRGVVLRTNFGNRLGTWIHGEGAKPIDVDRWIGKGTFYLIMLFVLIAFFQALGLTLITDPLNTLLTLVFQFAPRLLAAGLLLLVALVVASLSRWILKRSMSVAKIDERLGSQAGIEEEKRVPLSTSIANAVYWLILLLFLPAILSALSMEGILEPIQSMISKILAFLPNIFIAGLILVLGWFIARIVQRIVTNLLAAVGADRLSESTGLAAVLGIRQLSGLLGLIVYILILIPILIAALNALALESITRPASDMLRMILAAIPAIFVAILVLTIAYMVGKVVAKWITNVLTKAGFNGLLVRLELYKEMEERKWTPSAIAGYLVLVAIMLFAAMEASDLLGFEALSEIVAQFVVFAGHVILGLVIFALGLFLADVVSKALVASGKAQAELLAWVARIAIVVLASAMALRQMGLADEIINLAFALLFGAIAVAAAIAFGLGGREFAARQIEEWFQSMMSKKPSRRSRKT